MRSLTRFLLLFSIEIPAALAENDPTTGYVEAAASSGSGMTLWQVIQNGGWVMVVLGLLSVLMIALVIYLFLRLRPEKLVPEAFAHEMIEKLRAGNESVVKSSCQKQENLIAVILMAGVNRSASGLPAIKEAVEVTAKKEAAGLWIFLSYLSDIAAVAPMLGLLGTVVGMIQAFNTIAFQTAVVKPILLAAGVSKAMVTTAGGLIIAIAAIGFYSFFRFKLQKITSLLEIFTDEIMEAFTVARLGERRK